MQARNYLSGRVKVGNLLPDEFAETIRVRSVILAVRTVFFQKRPDVHKIVLSIKLLSPAPGTASILRMF